MAFLKFIIPIKAWRNFCGKIVLFIAESWIFINSLNIALTKKVRWDVKGLEGLDLNGWYLVVSNHQTWVDILVLQKVLFRKIPFLKFFLKKELIWVPIMGLVWWALEYPFMKRYSEEFLKKNPHLKGKDMETTRKACEKFKTTPVSVMNFVEGTRFTKEKHDKQKSPFKNLLKPKAGGISFVLSAMQDQLQSIVNVTIVYPDNREDKSFWAFLCGKVTNIVVRVETIPIQKEITGDYAEDEAYRKYFFSWLNELWTKKDATIESLLNPPREGK
jgi:1-acyl-sn-glycerol-3-phosphate acyltransferase